MLVRSRMIVCATVAGVMVSLGGCVSNSTHKKTLADLNQTRAGLQQERTARGLAEQDNARLKAGLLALSDQCRSAQTQIRTLNAAVVRIKVGERRVAETLDKLYQLVSAQAGSTAALQASSSPLAGEIDDIQARTAALLKPPASQPQDALNQPALSIAADPSGP